mgnify:FL=1|jgi:hypothetical protein|tara:strand:+ start:918 stop:1130 length:213 start_codon:yes stop_codon:yes gene_type:complete
MLWISELMLQNQPASFAHLIALVGEKARGGERFLRMDVKPPYPDTPGNWEDQVESAFTAALDASTGERSS